MSPNSTLITDPNIINRHLSGQGLLVGIGPICSRISIKFPSIREEFLHIYKGYPFFEGPEITDFYLDVYARNFYRRYIRPQVLVNTLMQDDFVPLPESMGLLSVEMGLNLQVAYGCKTHILFHAGVVERNGVGVIIPAISGSGKSTLSAGLSYDGARFFSDEFGMLDAETGELYPYPRPISLKNESIAVMKEWVGSDEPFSREYEGTPKGTICYLRPPASSLENMYKPVKPRVVIHPVYDPDAKPEIKMLTKTMAFFRLVRSSANYGDIGETAFHALAKIADECISCEITYSSLEEAIGLVDQFIDENLP
ncbi:MAG: HprK-related kinase A [Emcibacter sp.]|nr:HprK-related kinase A [Emcibacter sp.]MBL4894999.1 HprK-related kinase A [Emcibacter sp.]